MIETKSAGDLGLDLLLGGGWRLVSRVADRPSATVLIRGGAGAWYKAFQTLAVLTVELGWDIPLVAWSSSSASTSALQQSVDTVVTLDRRPVASQGITARWSSRWRSEEGMRQWDEHAFLRVPTSPAPPRLRVPHGRFAP